MPRIYNMKTSFREHLEAITIYADTHLGLNKTALCRASNIAPKRYSDFDKGRKNLTAYYFLKLLGGIGMTEEDCEERVGITLSEAQRGELKYQKFMEVNQLRYMKVMKSPRLKKLIDTMIDNYED